MTVAELAKECNVHYNTMRKWLADNNVKKTSSAKNAQYIITEDILKKAKTTFFKDEQEENNDKKIYEILTQQLQKKDQQIVELQKQVMHLQKILENQQILTLHANKAIGVSEFETSTEEVQEKKSELEDREEIPKKKWYRFWE